MIKWIKKWADKLIIRPYMPKDNSKKYLSGKGKEIKISDLQYKTKAELEKLGRKIGIELDKRLTKQKLINQIKKKIK
tara:strand:+ start:525 stop:755 length:231 start_codon:yes stop_codon:yes gene_type:complete